MTIIRKPTPAELRQAELDWQQQVINRAERAAKSVAALVTSYGGKTLDVAEISIALPAFTFDRLRQAMVTVGKRNRIGTPKGQISLDKEAPVRFTRGFK